MRCVFAAAVVVLAVLCASSNAVADGRIVGVEAGLAELELFKAHDAEEAALTVATGDLQLPTAILEKSANGMLKLRHQGADYWVFGLDVVTDSVRAVDTAGCAPKVAGTLVAHGKRGQNECQ